MKKIAIFLTFLLGFNVLIYAQNYTSQIQLLKTKINSTQAPSLKAQYYIKLGNIYQNLDSVDQAIDAYTRALNYLTGSRNYLALYQLNTFLGILYSEKGQYQKANQYFSKSVSFARKLNDKRKLSQALFNQGNTLMQLKKYQEAITKFEEALSIAFDLDNLALVKKAYTNIALCYKALGNQKRYLQYFNLSVAIDRKIKEQIIKQKELEARKQAQIARQKELLLQVQKYKTKTVEDSLKYAKELNEKNRMRIALLEKEKKLKELEIQRREAELKKKAAELRQRQIVIVSLSVLLIVILVAVALVYKLYRDKKAAYKELEIKNRQIRESIEYASRIQRAILPSEIAIRNNFPAGSFIFYQARDVVSGDFYWFSDHGKYKFLALVDCTGHSVPGAFMSLIGNTMLNEIVNSKRIFDPAQVLLELHKEVVTLLNQESTDFDTVQDGMDIVLCRFNTDDNTLTFASANQPLFVFYPDGKYELYKGDIYSIGGFAAFHDVKFENKTIPLPNGTNIYLSSDGYFDQFNGKTYEKFTRRRFIELLKQIYNLPMDEQYKIIRKTFEEWKDGMQQLDDVLVIGVRYLDKEKAEQLRKKLQDIISKASSRS